MKVIFQLLIVILVSTSLHAQTETVISDKEVEQKDEQILETLPPTSLFFGATAFGIPKDVHVYRNVSVLWNSFDMGLGKGFSVGGSTLLPLVYNLNAKYSYAISPKAHVGANVNWINSWFDDVFFNDFKYRSTVLLSGVATLGTPKLFVNVTAGFYVPILREKKLSHEFIGLHGGVGVGGEVKNFTYKVEGIYYQDVQNLYNDQIDRGKEGRFTLSGAIGFKRKKSRYEVGVMLISEVGVIPYLAFQTHF